MIGNHTHGSNCGCVGSIGYCDTVVVLHAGILALVPVESDGTGAGWLIAGMVVGCVVPRHVPVGRNDHLWGIDFSCVEFERNPLVLDSGGVAFGLVVDLPVEDGHSPLIGEAGLEYTQTCFHAVVLSRSE